MAGRRKTGDTKTAEKAFALAKRVKRKARYNDKAHGADMLDSVRWLTKANIRNMGHHGQRRLIGEMEDYLYRYNEETNFVKNKHGVSIPLGKKRAITQANLETKRNKRKEERAMRNKQMHLAGGQTNMTVEERNRLFMQHPRESNIYDLPDIDFDQVESEEDLKRVEKKIEVRERINDPQYIDFRKEQYKINFIANVYKSLNTYADEVVRELEDIPADDFYELSLQFEPLRFIDPSEPLDDDLAQAKAEAMLAIIRQYKRGEVNMNLKFIE